MLYNTKITAHSGCESTPDNSIEHVKMALTTNADVLEIDIRKNQEGILFLSHDSTNNSAGCPTLKEAFEIVAQSESMKVNCDLKEAGLEKDVFKVAKETGMEKRLIYSGTVSSETYANDEELHSNVEVYMNIEEVLPHIYRDIREIPDYDIVAAYECAKVCHAAGIKTVNSNEWLISKRLIDVLRTQGIGVSAWTVSNPRAVAWFIKCGCENVTTRKPLKAVAIRNAMNNGEEVEMF